MTKYRCNSLMRCAYSWVTALFGHSWNIFDNETRQLVIVYIFVVRTFSNFLIYSDSFTWNCSFDTFTPLLPPPFPTTLTHTKIVNIYLLIQIHFYKEHNCGFFIFFCDISIFFIFGHYCLCLWYLYTDTNTLI